MQLSKTDSSVSGLFCSVLCFSEIRPRCYMHQHFIPFYCWVLHHGKIVHNLMIYLPVDGAFFWGGSNLGLSWAKFLWVFEYKSFMYTLFDFSWVNKHLGMALFSHIVSLDLAYKVPPYCFPKSCTIFTRNVWEFYFSILACVWYSWD